MTVSDSERTTKPPISGAQLRAARALLKWSVRDLSAQCRVSRSAIARGKADMGGSELLPYRTVQEHHLWTVHKGLTERFTELQYRWQ